MCTPEEGHVDAVDGEGGFDLPFRRRTLLAGVLSLPIASAATSAPLETVDPSFTGFQGKPIERRVEELVAREEVYDLIGRYAHRVAQGVSAASLYTDDGALIVRLPARPVLEVRGRKALNAHFAKAASEGPVFNMMHNIDLDFSDNECIAICSDKLIVLENGELRQYRGFYRDRIRRINGQWRFVSREGTFFNSSSIEGS